MRGESGITDLRIHGIIMKRVLQLLMMCCMVIGGYAQSTITQKGVAYRYNGKKPRTPLGNVSVTCASANATVLSNEQNGTFSLLFKGFKMGDRLGMVTVRKRDMMVFNQQAVDEWSVRKEPLCLILCDADEFEQQKLNLINIGRREAKKKYDRLKAELEAKLNASQIKEAEYEAALDKAYEELERARKHVDRYADLFARIDESEIDTQAQEAVELFNQGEVERAIQLFEQGNYMEKLKQDNRTIEQADQMIRQAKKAKQQAQQDREAHIRSLKAQIEAYKVQNEWQKAGQLLKGLADELQTLPEVEAYAKFCQEQQEFTDAETYLRKYLTLVEADKTHADYRRRVSAAYSNLGVLCQRLKRFEEAEDYLKQSQTIRQSLLRQSDNASMEDLAVAYNNLGGLYREFKRYDDAIQMFKEAIQLYRQLFQRSENYAGKLGTSLNNLGTMYWDVNNLADSEKCYDEALTLHRKYYDENDNEKVEILASTVDNMASLNLKKRDFVRCEQLHLEALSLRRQLVARNPQAYSEKLAYTLGNLGNFYQTTGQLDKSLPMYEEALTVFRQLSEKYPLVYQTLIAMTQMNMGALYTALGNTERSIVLLQDALTNFQELSKRKKGAYDVNIGMALANLANAYISAHRHAECQSVTTQALEVFGRLAEQNPAAFNPYVAFTLNTQAVNSIYLKQYAEAESQVRQAIGKDASQTLYQANLASALLLQGKYAEAEAIYSKYKTELKTSFLDDLRQYAEAGVIPKERERDVERIKKMLAE